MSTDGPAPGKSNSYDGAGNVVGDGIVLYTYGDSGRLKSMVKAVVETVYLYNAVGERVSKTSEAIATGVNYYVYYPQGKFVSDLRPALTIKKLWSRRTTSAEITSPERISWRDSDSSKSAAKLSIPVASVVAWRICRRRHADPRDCVPGQPSADRQHQVVPLAEAFSYHVRGEVKTIAHHSEPRGNRTTYVVAGDAAFALSLADLGDLRPSEGDAVEFDVHGLSLWDESI